MKQYLFSLLGLLAVQEVCLAQPVLEAGSFSPTLIDQFSYRGRAQKDPGGAGPDQVWNFDNNDALQMDFAGFKFCPGTNLCDSFPGANTVFYEPGYTDPLMFWEVNHYLQYDSFQQAAYGFYAQPATTGYNDDPEVLMRYPFTYDSTFSDSFSLMIYRPSEGIHIYRKGYKVVAADAYGYLNLNGGWSWQDSISALRVHEVKHYQDSIPGDSASQIKSYATEAYYWYTDVPFALGKDVLPYFKIVITSGDEMVTDTMAFKLDLPEKIETQRKAVLSLSIYPQPATQKLQVRFETEQVYALSFQLTDISGRIVKNIPAQNFAAGQNEKTMDVSQLAPGFYMLTLMNGNQRIAVQKVQVL